MIVETLITEKELCEWLRVSRSTVKKLRANDLPYFSIGSIVRYSKEDVQEWLEKHQHLIQQEENDAYMQEEIDATEDHEGQDENAEITVEDLQSMHFGWQNNCKEQ